MPRRPASKISAAASWPPTRRHRYWVIAFLGALALASPLAIAAAPAAAQGIQFGSVSGDGSGDLTVTVTSDYPLTDWTLSLSNGTNTYTLDDFTDFTDTSAPFNAGTPQTYVLNASAAKQDLETTLALPPGNYTATATAATAGTGSNVETLASSQLLTGTFAYLAQPTLALSGPSFYTTQPSQAVTIKGQITGCSTLACPASWSNTSVTVTDVTAASPKPQWTGSTTDATGDFSVSNVTGVPDHSYSASLAAVQGTSLPATAPSTTLDQPLYAQTLITATAANAAYGKQTIKGTLTYQSGLQQAPSPSGVTIVAKAGSHTLSTTTRTGGAFSLKLPGIIGMTTWLLSTPDNLTTTPFLAGTQSSVGATQLWPTAISRFAASLAPDDLLTVSGCMVFTISPPPPHPPGTDINLDWRRSRGGHWTWFGSVATSRKRGCAGLYFTAQGTPPALSAYYRAYVTSGTTYAGSTSASTDRVWIHQTRFDPFGATPHTVAAGQKITVKGTLQYHGGKWRGLAHQLVAIIFSRNKKNWGFLKNVRTNGKGEFSLTFPDDYGSGWWSANYLGNKRDLAVAAGRSRVKVHGHASANLTAPVSRPTGLRPVSRLSDPSLGLGGWVMAGPYAMSPDPWLALMG